MKISINSLSMTYPNGKQALQDISLELESPSLVGLLGPNGAGKSTLMKLLVAGLTESAGTILADGAPLRKNETAYKRRLGYLPQSFGLYDELTVERFLEYMAALKGLHDQKKAVQAVLSDVNLEEKRRARIRTLSGGQRQRVALARAIVKKPAVFLMDEPLSNLDAKLRNQIRTDLIELYRKLGTTFVYVTHDQVEAMSMGTDIVLLEKGVIRQSTTPNEIYQHPANVFTAKFIGSPPMNVLDASAFTELGVSLPEGTRYVGFRPEIAMVASSITGLTGDYVAMEGDLLAREMLGDQTLYKVQTPYGIVHVKIFDDWGVGYGKVTIVVKKSNLFFFDQQEQAIA